VIGTELERAFDPELHDPGRAAVADPAELGLIHYRGIPS
jgi:hypothetical protein